MIGITIFPKGIAVSLTIITILQALVAIFPAGMMILPTGLTVLFSRTAILPKEIADLLDRLTKNQAINIYQ